MSDILMERCKSANRAGIQNLLEGRRLAASKKFKEALQVVKIVVNHYELVAEQEPLRGGRRRSMGQKDDQQGPPPKRRLCFPARGADHHHYTDSLQMVTAIDICTNENQGPGESPSLTRGEANTTRPQMIQTGVVIETAPEEEAMGEWDNTSGPHQCSSFEPLDNNDNEEEQDCSHEYDVYEVPLQIADFATFSNRHAAMQVSVSIIFNLAIAHHLLALGRDNETACTKFAADQQDLLFRQAIGLYEIAYKLAVKEAHRAVPPQQQEGGNNGMPILSMESIMAIVNNMGHIYCMQGQKEDASRCFHLLLSTIMFCQLHPSVGEDDDGRNVVAAEATQLFLLSISSFCWNKSGPMAPAA